MSFEKGNGFAGGTEGYFKNVPRKDWAAFLTWVELKGINGEWFDTDKEVILVLVSEGDDNSRRAVNEFLKPSNEAINDPRTICVVRDVTDYHVCPFVGLIYVHAGQTPLEAISEFQKKAQKHDPDFSLHPNDITWFEIRDDAASKLQSIDPTIYSDTEDGMTSGSHVMVDICRKFEIKSASHRRCPKCRSRVIYMNRSGDFTVTFSPYACEEFEVGSADTYFTGCTRCGYTSEDISEFDPPTVEEKE